MPFQIIRNDITEVAADAIINTANPEPVIGAGVDHAVYQAAGTDAMLAARRKFGRIEPGTSVWTPAFGLPAKYVIHTVSTPWRGGHRDERRILRNCYRSSLWLARELGCRSVAFPLLATGSYGFPKDEALQIAIEEISAFLLSSEMNIWLVVFDRNSYALSTRLFHEIKSYIDDHRVSEVREAEYLPRPHRESARWRRKAARDTAGRAEEPDAKQEGAKQEVAEQEDAEQEGAVSADAVRAESIFLDAAYLTDAIGEEAPEPGSASGAFAADPARPTAVGAADPAGMPDFSRVGKSFRDQLFTLIDERGLTDPEVYKKANLDRKLFSKIRSNPSYRPAKKTALALAVAMQLDLEETTDLLGRAEYALSPSSPADLIVQYFIEHRDYDIFKINAVLFQYDQPLLGQ